MKIVLRCFHKRVKSECRASTNFTIEIPILQDGFYDRPVMLCAWCKVEPEIVSEVLVDDAPPATDENLRSKPVSRIEEFREVRERLMWDGDTTVVPTQDGTPLSRKMFVETLCVAQSRIRNSHLDTSRAQEHIARLQVLIDIFSDRG